MGKRPPPPPAHPSLAVIPVGEGKGGLGDVRPPLPQVAVPTVLVRTVVVLADL